jgi:hypothetical protein
MLPLYADLDRYLEAVAPLVEDRARLRRQLKEAWGRLDQLLAAREHLMPLEQVRAIADPVERAN